MANKKKSNVDKNLIKKFTILNFIQLGSSLLFSLLMLSFHADISLLAFPIAALYTACIIYFAYFKFIKAGDGNKSTCVLKLIQYLPFVLLLTFILRRSGKSDTPYWVDVVSVILWFVIFFVSLFSAGMMNDKKIGVLTAAFAVPKKKYNKPEGGLRVLYEIVDWIDAIVQAVFLVLTVQIFVIQFYKIPSESMVPTFLIKDKVLVTKVDCGPKFPLTDVGLPTFRTYKRGDTVVLRNPHYSMDRKSEVKTVVSQLVSMLTFMTVNLNTDENGEQKADPLVKRIAGVPGDQLVMQDGVLYSRNSKNQSFQPVVMDAKYATWDLTKCKPEVRDYIQTFPLATSGRTEDEIKKSAAENYNLMLDLEEERRKFDLTVAEFQAKELVNKVKKLSSGTKKDGNFVPGKMDITSLFTNSSGISKDILYKNGGTEWFEKFMTAWIPSKNENRDMYSEANYKLNVMTKICFGNIVVRYMEYDSRDEVSANHQNDELLMEQYAKAEFLIWYIQGMLDERNMPVFPPDDKNGNAQYIPSDCYFMMGDNRFNSLDLRHSSDFKSKALAAKDSMSVEYYSNMAPQYVNKKLIIGKPAFRFLPTNRIGRVR